jgi:hypothetical protein
MMMSVLIASAAVASLQGGSQATPQGLFLKSCFSEKATLSAGEGTSVPFTSLPTELQARLGSPSKSQVWQVGGDMYFYRLDYADPKVSPEVCGVISKAPFRSTGDAVARALNASTEMEDDAVTRQWWLVDNGFMALASKVRDYTVLQVNWLSPAQIAEAKKNK